METIFPLIISDTDSTLMSMCELRWFRERCQCLTSGKKNIDLIAGGHFAKAMEIVRKSYYLDKLSEEESIEIGYEFIVDSMQAEVENKFDDELKNPVRMGKVLLAYFKAFPLEDEEVVPHELEDNTFSIEHTLTAELPVIHPELKVPLIFKGKMDMLGKHLGRNYIVDEKTTKQIKSNEGEMLQASGQFFGYGWLCEQNGIDVYEARVRKAGIYKTDTKFQEIPIVLTKFAIDNWFRSLVAKLDRAVVSYEKFMKDSDNFRNYFIPDYKLGCTAFMKPCPFVDGCTSVNGEGFIASSFEQKVWDGVNRQEISIEDFRKNLGLE